MRNFIFGAIVVTAATSAFGGVAVTTAVDAPTFPGPGTPALATTATPQVTDTVNQQASAGASIIQTFTTGATGFKLDKFQIYSGGKAGANVTINLYANPIGGGDADGFVNTSFSTDMLNGGNGITATISGSGGLQYINFDLTGSDEVTLAPNTKYGLEFDITSGTFSWQRGGAGQYVGGNIYAGASELNFNGTPPAGGRGERDQVGGTPDRDGALALFAVSTPEPMSLSTIALAATALVRRRRA